MGKHDMRLHNQSPAYEKDWAAWVDHQVELIKARRFDELDIENLVDEVSSLGLSNYRAFISALRIVLLHMLKWDYQPDYRGRSWLKSIVTHRFQVEGDLEDNPSYEARIPDAVRRAYRQARRQAAMETGLSPRTFPETCPYDWDEITTREHKLDA